MLHTWILTYCQMGFFIYSLEKTNIVSFDSELLCKVMASYTKWNICFLILLVLSWLSAIPLWGTPWPGRVLQKDEENLLFYSVYEAMILCRRSGIKKRDMFPMVQVFPVIEKVDGRKNPFAISWNHVCSILYCGTGNCCTQEILTFRLGRIFPLKLMAFVNTQMQQSLVRQNQKENVVLSFLSNMRYLELNICWTVK